MKIVRISLCVALCLMISTLFAYSQAQSKFNKYGISFNYPAGSEIKDDSAPGQCNQIHCTTPTGNFFSVSAYLKKVNAEAEIREFKVAFEKQYKSMGASNIKFREVPGITGWEMTFTLNRMNFICTAAYSESYNGHGRQVILLRQWPVRGKASSPPAEIVKSIESLDVR